MSAGRLEAAWPNARGRRLVANGASTAPGDFSHTVAIVDASDQNWLCGGSLIDAQHILTAAHCMYPYGQPSRQLRSSAALTVHVGRWRFDRTRSDWMPDVEEPGSGSAAYYGSSSDNCTQAIGVERIAVHPDYRHPPDITMDVAVLKLATPARCIGAEITPVRLSPFAEPRHHLQPPEYAYPLDDALATIVGWGATRSHPIAISNLSLFPRLFPDVLQALNVTLLNHRHCRAAFEQTAYVFPTSMLCSLSPDLQGGSCGGDSGGPVTLVPPIGGGGADRRPVQVGIVSFGVNNGSHTLCHLGFGAYASVAAARVWIEAQQLNDLGGGWGGMSEGRVVILAAPIGTAVLLLLVCSSWVLLRRGQRRRRADVIGIFGLIASSQLLQMWRRRRATVRVS